MAGGFRGTLRTPNEVEDSDRVAGIHSSRKDAKNAKSDSLISLVFFADFAPLREAIRPFIAGVG
jgi:hypothetical protein